MENIPGRIYDMCAKRSFNELNAQEQNEVLASITEEEYNKLRETLALSRSLSFNEETLGSNNNKKDLLMDHLRQKNKKVAFINTPLTLWKVAASFLLFGFAFFYLYAKKPLTPVHYLTQTDTLYLEKQLPGTQIFDTIYVSLSNEKNKAKASTNDVSSPVIETIPENLDFSSGNAGLGRLSVKDYDQPRNNRKGSTIKDDSLIEKIGFVHL